MINGYYWILKIGSEFPLCFIFFLILNGELLLAMEKAICDFFSWTGGGGGPIDTVS